MTYKDKEKRKEYDRQRRISYRERGLCKDCNLPRFGGSKYCLFHLEKQRRYAKKNRNKLDVIINHKKWVKENYYNRKSENRCVDCGMPLNTESRMGIRCVNCYSKGKGF